jgi:hypothetical protein
VALSGSCDILDGELARRSGIRSRFGAFLDSTLDRLSDGIVLAGIAGFYLVHSDRAVLEPSAGRWPRSPRPRAADLGVVSLTAVLAMLGSIHGVLHPRARRGARPRVPGRLVRAP